MRFCVDSSCDFLLRGNFWLDDRKIRVDISRNLAPSLNAAGAMTIELPKARVPTGLRQDDLAVEAVDIFALFQNRAGQGYIPFLQERVIIIFPSRKLIFFIAMFGKSFIEDFQFFIG